MSLCIVGFETAIFRGETQFNESSFACSPNFNNASFGSTTSFARAEFTQPPRFFETDLHEDTDFSGIDWQASEASYKPLGLIG